MQAVLAAVILCLQVFAVKTDDFPFYAMIANSTAHNCTKLKDIGPNHATATVTYPSTNVSLITFTNIDRESGLNLTKAEIQITPSSNKMNVRVMVEAMDKNQNSSVDLNKNGEVSWKPNSNGGGFKQMILRGTNFTGNATYVVSCIDVGLAYSGQNSTNDVVVMNVGCWTWNNSTSSPLTFTIPSNTSYLTSWAKNINSNTCNGALSTQNIAPAFALLLSFLVYSFNKV